MKLSTQLPWSPRLTAEEHSKRGVALQHYGPHETAAVPSVPRRGAGVGASNSAAAQTLLGLLASWDKGSTRFRLDVLHDFVAGNAGKTGPELERALGGGAALFLTRISAWLRLTYLCSPDLWVQMQALNVFMSAAGGQSFLAEFVESGGLLTILEILGLPKTSDAEKIEALRLVQHVASAGRQFKEFICEGFGIRVLVECLARSKAEATVSHCKSVVVQIATGNNKFQTQVHKALLALLGSTSATAAAQIAAAQVLRQLIPRLPHVQPEMVELVIQLLRTLHLQLQYEAFELLLLVFQRPELEMIAVKQVVAALTQRVEGEAGGLAGQTLVAAPAAAAGSPTAGPPGSTGPSNPADDAAGRFGDLPLRAPLVIAQYIQQAYCAKLVGMAVATSEELARRFIDHHVVGGLLNVVANMDHPEGQRFAASALLYLVEQYPYVKEGLEEQAGSRFVELITSRPDTFYREFTRPQIDYLRHNNVVIMRTRKAVVAEDADSDEVVEASMSDLTRMMRDRGAIGKTVDESLSLMQGFPATAAAVAAAAASASEPAPAAVAAAPAPAESVPTEPLAAEAPKAATNQSNNEPPGASRGPNARALDVPAPQLFQPMAVSVAQRSLVGRSFGAASEASSSAADAQFDSALHQYHSQRDHAASGDRAGDRECADGLVSASDSSRLATAAQATFRGAVQVPEAAKKSHRDAGGDFFQSA